MSQKDQVLAALEKIGKGTTLQVLEAIPDTSGWTAKDKKASVAGELSKLRKKGIVKQEGKIWLLERIRTSQDSIIKSTLDDIAENCLYLITIHPSIESLFAGLPFKIGSCEKDLRGRIKGYNACLPFDTIHFIRSFPIQLPDGVKIEEIEKQVRDRLIKNTHFGFRIVKLHGGNQKEWFTATDLRPIKEHIDKLATAIEKIVKEVTKLSC